MTAALPNATTANRKAAAQILAEARQVASTGHATMLSTMNAGERLKYQKILDDLSALSYSLMK